MKNLILFLLLFIPAFGIAWQSGENFYQGEKVYVSPGSIYVSQDAIYMHVNEQFIPVESLAIDEGGVYANLGGYCLNCGKVYFGPYDSHLKNCPARK
jgi:hypothetical protein